jgi:hypothetical protein
MFGNRVLRKMFRPKKDEVAGEWRRLHHEKLYNLYFPPNILMVRVIKSGKSRRDMWHILGKREFRTGFWWGNLREGNYFEELSLDKRIILKLVFMESDGGHGTGLIWPSIGTGGCCVCGNECSHSLKGEESLEY